MLVGLQTAVLMWGQGGLVEKVKFEQRLEEVREVTK